MKLIKIISREDQETGFFQVDFTQPLVIKPHSKVALINASFSIDTKQIGVNTSNNTLTYKRKDTGNVYDVVIPVGTYTQTGFLRALYQSLSVAQTAIIGGADNLDTNFQWNIPALGDDGLLSLDYRRQGIQPMSGTLTSMRAIDTQTQACFVAEAGNSPANQFNHFGYSTLAFSNGTGVFEVGFRDTTYANKSSGIMGILQSKPTGDAIKVSDFKYGIRADSGGNYYTIENGVETDSGYAVEDDETCRIVLCGEDPDQAGKIVFQIAEVIPRKWIDMGVSSTVFDFNAGAYFPCVGVAASGTSVTGVRYTSDPFSTTNLDDMVDELGAVKATKLTLVMTDESSELLGFDEKVHQITSLTGSFKATIPLVETNTPPSLTIELPSLGEFQSYDSVSGDRRQILGVAPLFNNLTSAGNLNYSPPYPLFVDVDNAFPIPISQLVIRVLNSTTNLPVDLDGDGTSMVIAIADSNESTH